MKYDKNTLIVFQKYYFFKNIRATVSSLSLVLSRWSSVIWIDHEDGISLTNFCADFLTAHCTVDLHWQQTRTMAAMLKAVYYREEPEPVTCNLRGDDWDRFYSPTYCLWFSLRYIAWDQLWFTLQHMLTGTESSTRRTDLRCDESVLQEQDGYPGLEKWEDWNSERIWSQGREKAAQTAHWSLTLSREATAVRAQFDISWKSTSLEEFNFQNESFPELFLKTIALDVQGRNLLHF